MNQPRNQDGKPSRSSARRTKKSAKVRALYAAGVTDQTELARRADASRQLVSAALRRSGEVGRPSRELVKLSIGVPVDTGAWLREQAEHLGCSLGDVVHKVVEQARNGRKRHD